MDPSVPAASWTYALVTADSVIAGEVGTVVRAIHRHGLVPRACQLVQLDMLRMFCGPNAEDVDFLIENPGGKDVMFSLKMHDELYELAPACVVLIADPDGDACKRMLACKGATRPEQAAPGTIRHLGENVIFNFAHCPDDVPSARRELTNLLGASADRLIELAHSADPVVERLLGIEATQAALPAFQGREATSFPAVANRLQRRIVQRVARESSGDVFPLLTSALTSLDDQRMAFERKSTSRERMLAALQWRAEIQAALAATAEAHGDPGLRAAVDALGAMYRLDGDRRLDVTEALRRHGVYVSALEAVIVRSHDYAFRPSDELTPIYG